MASSDAARGAVWVGLQPGGETEIVQLKVHQRATKLLSREVSRVEFPE